MRIRTVISITGQARSGKDTVAHIIQMHNQRFVQYAFADPVRDVAKAFFGWTDKDFTDEYKEQMDPYWGLSPRQALQFIGTDVGRIAFAERFPDFALATGGRIWIKRFYKFLDTLHEDQGCIVSDVRFANEHDAIKVLEKEQWRVIRLGVTRPGANGDGHASEAEVPQLLTECDHVFENNTTVDELHTEVLKYIRREGIEYGY